jgi:gluconate:H+ symporter, GntP family
LAGLPMVAGLSVVHGLIPPHPAAMLAVTIYHADVGRTILYGLLIGTPTADDMALLVGVLFSFTTLGVMRGFSRDTVLRFSNECLGPTAAITLLVGAGGGFGRVLQDCGVSGAIIVVAMKSHVPLLLLAWLLAAAMRLATGSATVAMATAANIVAPIALQSTGVHPELLAIATGAGALIFSHVNDGGFWLVKEYFNMTVGQTMKTWSVTETIISVTALGFTAAAWHFA